LTPSATPKSSPNSPIPHPERPYFAEICAFARLGPSTQFTYATAGNFTARVTVIDADGGMASAATALSVQSPAQALATADALVQQLPLNKGQQNSLSSKLNAVAGDLNRDDPADGRPGQSGGYAAFS
jgi:hypothetical protein